MIRVRAFPLHADEGHRILRGPATQEAQCKTDEPWKTADDSRRWMALYVLCVGMLMIVLDATIVNVALPRIQADLGFSRCGGCTSTAP